MVNGQTAGIGTSAAFCHSRGVLHGFDIINGKHGSAFTVRISFSGDQSSSKSAHNTGNIRTDCLAVRNFFKTSQNGIIIESTALNDNMISKFLRAGYFNYFKKRVFDNGVSQAGRNIRYRSTLFLSLLYF